MRKTWCPLEHPCGQSLICSLISISIALSSPLALRTWTLWSGHTFEVLPGVKMEHEGNEVAELFNWESVTWRKCGTYYFELFYFCPIRPGALFT